MQLEVLMHERIDYRNFSIRAPIYFNLWFRYRMSDKVVFAIWLHPSPRKDQTVIYASYTGVCNGEIN
jgi:hypothetical protein